MTRYYQKGHARKVLRVEMVLPYSVTDDESGVREPSAFYRVGRLHQKKVPEPSSGFRACCTNA